MVERNLKNTILLDDNEYNITATHSEMADEAAKVSYALKVKESGKDNSISFDGSKEITIDYVPADKGGTFSNPVYLSNPTAVPTDNELLTSKQINTRVADLNGAPLCVWDTRFNPSNFSKNLYALKYHDDEGDKVYKFTTITGTESDFELFKDTISGAFSNSNQDLGYSLYSEMGGASAGIKVSKANEASGVVVVPATHYGTYGGQTREHNVSALGDGVFSSKNAITGVVVSEGIFAVGKNCFNNSKNIRYVIIPDSVEALGGDDFDNRESSTTYYNRCFYGCSGLKKVLLGTGIRSIGRETFQNCSSLVSIVIPKNVTTIGVNAFSGCTSLVSIVLPAGLTSIADNAFANCPNLKTVYYTGSEADWAGISISSAGNTLINDAIKVYNYTITDQPLPEAPGAAIDIDTVSKGPFIYICKDEESTNIPASNKIFLKLPDVDDIVEISKGAARLESPTGATTTGFYTYETLAAIIAGINSRLAALGSTTLTLPSAIEDKGYVLIPEITDEAIKNKVLVSEDVVPTVQQLESAIAKIQGKGKTTISDILAELQSKPDSVKALRDDLDELAKEVEYELDSIDASQKSRIDKLELGDTPAGRAKKLYDSTKSQDFAAGNINKPVYFEGGVPKECSNVVISTSTEYQSLVESTAAADTKYASKTELANYKTVNSEAQTKIEQKADANKALIDSLTTWKNGASTSIANIEQKASANESNIKILSNWKDDSDEKIESIASIQTTANNNSASITQLAERVTKDESSLASFKSEVKDGYATQEMLSKVESGASTALATYKTEVSSTYAKSSDLTSFSNGINEAVAEISKTAGDNAAALKAVASYEKDGQKGLAGLVAQVDENKSSISTLAGLNGNLAGLQAQVEQNKSSVETLATWQSGIEDDVASIATIKQQAERNGAKLEAVVDNNGKAKASFIMEAVNDESAAKINADRLDIVGKKLNIKVDAANIEGDLTIGQLPDAVANKDDIPTNAEIVTISKGAIDANYISTLGLTVGNEITMGSNAKITWDNVDHKPDVATTSDVSTAQSNAINAAAADATTKANNAKAAAVDEVKKLDYQTSSQVETTATSITKNTIETGLLKAQNLEVNGAKIYGEVSADHINADGLEVTNGTFSGELKAATGTFSGELSAVTGSFTSGTIGGWSLSQGRLETADITPGAVGYFYLGTTDFKPESGQLYSVAGVARSDWRLIMGTSFGVSAGGSLACNNGNFGGWDLSGQGLQSYGGSNTAERVGMLSGSAYKKDDSPIRFFAGGTNTITDSPFMVTADGSLYASKADISGTISASAGSIARWDINSAGLLGTSYQVENSAEYNTSVKRPNVGFCPGWDGTSRYYTNAVANDAISLFIGVTNIDIPDNFGVDGNGTVDARFMVTGRGDAYIKKANISHLVLCSDPTAFNSTEGDAYRLSIAANHIYLQHKENGTLGIKTYSKTWKELLSS
jgi:hypothetical protein